LLPNAVHTAIITATNSLAHGISVTNSFDTFTESNFMVEAEDFDYEGGQFVNPWFPDAYDQLGGVTNVDFQHIPLAGEQFYNYRPNGVPQDKTFDYRRQSFLDVGAFDYSLTYFGNTDWVNFTRVFPVGNYYVYCRVSGDGRFSMYLDQVTGGSGTAAQVTRRLGVWSTVGRDYQTYTWVPLTDDGWVAPVVVKLNGTTTLRITTTGNCNPNYFMLVPASAINITAKLNGNSLGISFPTQAGVSYRVFYRDDLTSGSWFLLTNILGDGTTKTVSDPANGVRRFYKVDAP
jgi:hypothetical protein